MTHTELELFLCTILDKYHNDRIARHIHAADDAVDSIQGVFIEAIQQIPNPYHSTAEDDNHHIMLLKYYVYEDARSDFIKLLKGE